MVVEISLEQGRMLFLTFWVDRVLNFQKQRNKNQGFNIFSMSDKGGLEVLINITYIAAEDVDSGI